MESAVVDTTGTIDTAKQAFEGSYEAAKQDLSNSWNQLKETIGSGVVPALTWVVDVLNIICESVPGIGILVKNMFLEMGNNITQWSLGAIGKFQEFQIACIEGAIKIAEALGKDEWATKWQTNLENVKNKHSETVEKIKQNELDRTAIQEESQSIRDGLFNRDKENHKKAADSIISKNEEVKNSSSSTNNKLQTDSNTTASTVSKNTSKINKDISSNLNSAKSSAETSMTGVKGAVDSNMDGSLRTVQVQATEMYKGVKTSFHKMSQSAREDGTEMYLGVQTSAQKMASSAKGAATEMYKSVTTSTSRMAQKAIADWNSIRNAYGKSITGNVTVHKKTISSQETQSINELSMPGITSIDIMPINTARYVTEGQYYSIPTSGNVSNISNLDSKKEVTSNKNTTNITLKIENFNNNRDYDIEVLAEDLARFLKRKKVFI